MQWLGTKRERGVGMMDCKELFGMQMVIWKSGRAFERKGLASALKAGKFC